MQSGMLACNERKLTSNPHTKMVPKVKWFKMEASKAKNTTDLHFTATLVDTNYAQKIPSGTPFVGCLRYSSE